MKRRRIYPIGKPRLRFRLAFAAMVLLAFSVVISTPAYAAGTVTDCSAYDDGNPGDGADTLAEALVGGGMVTFSCSGTIIVPEISISDIVTIDATGQNVILDGNNANRIFNVTAAGNLTLNNLTVQNGSSAGNGGGINNAGTVTLTNVTLSGNSAAGPGGGGIRNDGTLTITNSTLSGNSADLDGGGIYNHVVGTVTLTNVTFSGNSAIFGGGGIRNVGMLTITDSTLSGNAAGNGGGIYNSGTVILNNSTFSGNTATFFGGGIFNTLDITNNTGSILTNDDPIANNNTITNDGTINNNNVITNLATIQNNATINNSCTGVITGNAVLGNQPISTCATTTTLTSNLNPSNFGDAVTFTAQVTATSGIPTGSVTFLDTSTGTNLGTSTLDGSGTTTLTVSVLTAGTHAIVANYVSNSVNYLDSTSTPLNQVVNALSTTTALTSNLNPSNEGDTITFTATVTAGAGAPTPTGTVTFLDTSTGTNLGTTTLDGSGQGSLTTNVLTAGVHTIQATYNGTADFLSSSDSLTQFVFPLPTITTLTSDLNPSLFGDSVTFTAMVTAASGTPTGDVTFLDTTTGTNLGTVTLDGSGQGSITTNVLTVGLHTIQATYSVSAQYDTSSDSITQTVNASATTTTLTSDLNPSNVGDNVTFTATVTAASGTPTGSVTFLDTTTGTNLGTTSLDGSGQATLTINSLASGSHDIEATYNPDPGFGTSSATLTQLVIGPPSVTINQGVGQADPTSTSPIVFDVVFSEAVTGFDGTAISFAGSTVGGTLVANVTGSGATYTVEVSGMTGTGTVVASIPAGAAQNGGGYLNLASTSTDNAVTFDDSAVVTPTPPPPPVNDLPAPPATPRCEDLNFVEDGVVRAITSDEIDYAVFCRVLYANGAPMQWLGGDLYNAGSIGHQGVLDLGVVQAVDVYSPVGLTHFEGGVEICLKGTGPLIFMAASGAPRVPVLISSHTLADFPSFTCATLFEPGTLVLVRDNPAA